MGIYICKYKRVRECACMWFILVWLLQFELSLSLGRFGWRRFYNGCGNVCCARVCMRVCVSAVCVYVFEGACVCACLIVWLFGCVGAGARALYTPHA